MQCRLGSLRPRAGAVMFSPHVQAALRHALDAWHREVATDRRARERAQSAYERAVVRSMREMRQQLREAPDLATALGPTHPDGGWVTAATATFDDLRGAGRPHLDLLECEWNEDRGSIAIAVDDPASAAAVRVGDTVSAGCAIVRDEDGGLAVLPRIYRKACTNGAIVHEGMLADVLAAARTIDAAIRRCFSPELVTASVARLRVASRVAVADPAPILARAGVRSSLVAIADAWQREDDRTGWGLLNAITAAARRELDFVRRVELEKDAGRVLAVLARRLRPAPAAPRHADTALPV